MAVRWMLVLLLIGGSGWGQTRARSVRRHATEAALAHAASRVLLLKLEDDGGASANVGRLHGAGAAASVLIAESGGFVEPAIPLDATTLARLRRRGTLRTGQPLADLSQLFRITLPSGPCHELVLALRECASVETVYALAQPGTPSFQGPVPDFTPLQGFRGPAPCGLDADFALSHPGGDGAGTTVVDIEFAWRLTHQDLSVRGPGALLGPAWNPAPTDHGTASIGILSANADTSGMTGMVPNANLRVVAVQSAGTATANFPAAMLLATSVLQAGDVILVELQWPNGPNQGANQFGSVPMEFFAADFMAIRQATALGIHVVEAAGNGSQDFDASTAPSGNPAYARFRPLDPAWQDSGAILVGAADANAAHAPSGFTNRGARVDAFGWGECVATLGYGPSSPGPCMGTPATNLFPGANGPDQHFTNGYNGTSSAAALVAGAVTSLTSVHTRKHGSPYRPEALRWLLRTSGTPSFGGAATDRIGRQPDLAAQIQVLHTGAQVGHVLSYPGNGWRSFGGAVGGVGDTNGDGVGDLLIGRPDGQGRVDLFDGRTGSNRFPNPLPLGFGWPLESLGQALDHADVTGDGREDLLIGGPGFGATAFGAGRVQVRDGGTGALVRTHLGATTVANLGASVAGLGDVDFDGRDDVLVGAPGAPFFGPGGSQGEAYVYSGRTGALLHVLSGPASGSRFGDAVARLPDVDGDGRDDLAVGAPNVGQVFVFSGTTGALLRILASGVTGDGFGTSLAGLPDVDGDGRGDVVVGAPRDATNGPDSGGIHVFSGSSGALLWAGSGNQGDRLGACVDTVWDRDGDGLADVVAGAPQPGTGPGRAYVLSGGSGVIREQFVGEAFGDLFGAAVADATDLDQDGRGDIIVGAPGHACGNGRAYVYLAPGATGPAPLPSLFTDVTSLDACTGGQVTIGIRAGVSFQGRPYVLAPSLAGAWPGLAVPGFGTIPLNPDALTTAALLLAGSAPFTNFTGTLDAQGTATATLGPFAPGVLAPLASATVTLAAVTTDLQFISDPTPLAIR